MSIKPQVLAAISGAIAAYMADEEACQAGGGCCGGGPGPALKSLGPGRAPGGHAAQAADAAAEFAVVDQVCAQGGHAGPPLQIIPPTPLEERGR